MVTEPTLHEPAPGAPTPERPASGTAGTPGRRMVWGFHPRFVDLNAGGHLDNVQILRAVDEGRHRLLGVGEPGGAQLVAGLLSAAPATVMPLVAGHHINYLREVAYAAEPLEVTLWICRIGGSSFAVATEVRQAPGEPLAAVAMTSVVAFDVADQRPWELSPQVREALAVYEGPVPPLR